MSTIDEGYVLADAERVVIRDWRRARLAAMGFDDVERDRLAERAEVDLHDVERWLARGATHLQVLTLVAPL